MKSALLIVDPLNDFCPGGALEVPDGDKIFPVVNRLAASDIYDAVVLIQEQHPQNHISFASRHREDLFKEITLSSGRKQMMWPDHCVRGTPGAEVHPALDLQHVTHKVTKGEKQDVENYSGFQDDDGEDTGLTNILKDLEIDRTDISGLALDYCVQATARHAVANPRNFETRIVHDATRGIGDPNTLENLIHKLEKSGIRCVRSDEILKEKA